MKNGARPIAFVDEHMGDAAEFAEDVAVNRGVPIKMFDDVEAASRWLVDDHNHATIAAHHG